MKTLLAILVSALCLGCNPKPSQAEIQANKRYEDAARNLQAARVVGCYSVNAVWLSEFEIDEYISILNCESEAIKSMRFDETVQLLMTDRRKVLADSIRKPVSKYHVEHLTLSDRMNAENKFTSIRFEYPPSAYGWKD